MKYLLATIASFAVAAIYLAIWALPLILGTLIVVALLRCTHVIN